MRVAQNGFLHAARRAALAAAFAAATALAAPARAQVITGRVVDAVSVRPLEGVTATLLDGNATVATARTNDSGFFRLTAPSAGLHRLRLSRLGYQALATDVKPDIVQGSANVYKLTQLATGLDTIVTRDRGTLFPVTLGREMFRQHGLTNKGQMVTGVELKRSKLLLSEYLGGLPGLRLVSKVNAPAPGQSSTVSPPTIPGKNGYLVPSIDERCLYGRIDHWSIIGLLDNQVAEDIDELFSPDEVMGVEVYTRYEDIPTDWRAAGFVRQLIWRTGFGGRDYLIGDTGFPQFSRYSIRANPRDPVFNDVAPREVKSLRAPGALGANSVKATVVQEQVFSHIEKTKTGKDTVIIDGGSPVYRLGVPIDTIAPPSFALPSMIVPQCGFVQIWTRISW